MVIVADDPIVGDGNTKEVSREIAQSGFAVSNGLGIDNPVLRPDSGVDLFQEAGRVHGIAKRGSDDSCQGFGVNEEILARGEPAGSVVSEPATRDDEVQMRMVLKL
jgi:hypothetical protein